MNGSVQPWVKIPVKIEIVMDVTLILNRISQLTPYEYDASCCKHGKPFVTEQYRLKYVQCEEYLLAVIGFHKKLIRTHPSHSIIASSRACNTLPYTKEGNAS